MELKEEFAAMLVVLGFASFVAKGRPINVVHHASAVSRGSASRASWECISVLGAL